MLEELTFALEEQQLHVELKTREYHLYYRVQSGDGAMGEWQLLESGRRWLRRLEKLHLTFWRAHYESAEEVLVHHRWQLFFRDTKVGARKCAGDAAYPEAWPAFIDLLNEIPGVEIVRVKQLEQVSLVLNDVMQNPGGNIYLPKKKTIQLTEKLVINRGKHLLVFTRHKHGIGTERHAFDSVRNVPLLLDRIARHAAGFTVQPDSLLDDYLPKVEWRLLWRDGSEEAGSYALKKQEMPPEWEAFIHEIEQFTGNVRGYIF